MRISDWSSDVCSSDLRVDLDALRRHLIDMNEVTLNAEAKVEAVGGGIRVTVTGQGRTLDAIRRMVPAHARGIGGHDGWKVEAEEGTDGEIGKAAGRGRVGEAG